MYSNGQRYIADRKPPIGALLNPYLSINNGLAGNWPFWCGAGNKVFDLSGNQSQYYGDFINSPTWSSGKHGPAIYFRGNTQDDAIKLRLWPGYPTVTFFAIVRFDKAIGVTEQITVADSNSDGHRTFQFRRTSTGKLGLIVFVGNAAKIIDGNTTLTKGVYYAVAAVNDGTNCHVYVNGIEDAIPVASGAMDNDASAWAIAGRPANDDFTNITEDMQGNIDCLYAYNRALSASEIALLNREPFCGFRWTSIEQLAAYIAEAPPEIKALFMDLSTQIWTIKHAKGLFTKL